MLLVDSKNWNKGSAVCIDWNIYWTQSDKKLEIERDNYRFKTWNIVSIGTWDFPRCNIFPIKVKKKL